MEWSDRMESRFFKVSIPRPFKFILHEYKWNPVILNEAQQSEESLHYEKDFSKSVNRKTCVLHRTSMMFL